MKVEFIEDDPYNRKIIDTIKEWCRYVQQEVKPIPAPMVVEDEALRQTLIKIGIDPNSLIAMNFGPMEPDGEKVTATFTFSYTKLEDPN